LAALCQPLVLAWYCRRGIGLKRPFIISAVGTTTILAPTIAGGKSLYSLTSGSCRVRTTDGVARRPYLLDYTAIHSRAQKNYRFALAGSQDFSKKSRELRSESGRRRLLPMASFPLSDLQSQE